MPRITGRKQERICWVLASALWWLSAPYSVADNFVPNDQIISDPATDLPAPEFDPVHNRMVWEDTFNRLWIADVDPETGDIIPNTGKGALLDTGLAPVAVIRSTPRFSYGSDGTILIYTKQIGGVLHLAVAREDAAGEWHPELLQMGENRWQPNGTPPGTPDPARIVYNYDVSETETIVAWRDIADPASERTIEAVGVGGRWMDTERAIQVMSMVDGFFQTLVVDTVTGTATQVTFGGEHKLNNFIWHAPEFQDMAFVTMIDKTVGDGLNPTELAIYRRNSVDGDNWTRVYTFTLPSAKPFLSSPEVFVSNGKSYVVVVTAEVLGAGSFPIQPVGPTEIWIAGIDPNEPFFRRIDDSISEGQRSEPEPFMTKGGPVVYYQWIDEATGNRLVRRADTGLGPEFEASSSIETFDYNGTQTYRLFTPDACVSRMCDLVVMFHGANTSGERAEKQSEFNRISGIQSPGKQFLVAYPDAQPFFNGEKSVRDWNDGTLNTANSPNDVGYVLALLDDIKNDPSLNLSVGSVYVTGISSGGIFALRLACEIPTDIVKVAAVGASYPSNYISQCPAAIPVMTIHGTDDTVVPYDGGEAGDGTRYISARGTILYWARKHHCPTRPFVDVFDDDPGDLSSVMRMSYCANVQHYRVIDGGHTWPGSSVIGPGITNHDISASEEIWKFFSGE